MPDTGSAYSQEGTEAHALGEFLLKTALGEETSDPRPEFKYYSDEMQSCAEGYRDEVLAIYEQVLHFCCLPLPGNVCECSPYLFECGARFFCSFCSIKKSCQIQQLFSNLLY